jgi:hypothetical protein
MYDSLVIRCLPVRGVMNPYLAIRSHDATGTSYQYLTALPSLEIALCVCAGTGMSINQSDRDIQAVTVPMTLQAVPTGLSKESYAVSAIAQGESVLLGSISHYMRDLLPKSTEILS